jgi:hypothetical protein
MVTQTLGPTVYTMKWVPSTSTLEFDLSSLKTANFATKFINETNKTLKANIEAAYKNEQSLPAITIDASILDKKIVVTANTATGKIATIMHGDTVIQDADAGDWSVFKSKLDEKNSILPSSFYNYKPLNK